MINKRFYNVLLLLFIATLLSGCDESIRPINYEFGEPPRVIYIAGVDIELDFYGATLITTLRNGWQHEDPFPLRLTETVEHTVNFNIPGIYKAEVLIMPDFRVPFYVEVIDANCETITSIKIGQYPRLRYATIHDSELDFSNATLVVNFNDGEQIEISLYPISESPLTVLHNIDFTEPGNYKVELIVNPDIYFAFYVRVERGLWGVTPTFDD